MKLEELFEKPCIQEPQEIPEEERITDRDCDPPREEDDGKGFYWYRGETVELVWDITGDVLNDETQEVIPAADFLLDKTVKVKMFNFIGRKIHEWDIQNPTTEIKIAIDDELAAELKTGTYKFTITIYNSIGMVCEVFSKSDADFEIR